MVCAPSLIPKKPGERVKTDRRDAARLTRSLHAGDLSAVYVPSVEHEAFRDLAGTSASAREGSKQARQRLKSFLLTYHIHSVGRSDWGAAHRRWLSKYTFDNAWRQLAFDEHRRTIEDRFVQCERLEPALREVVTEWRLYPVNAGIQLITAVGLISELGALTCFEHPRQLMSWFGLTPSEYSSGGSRHQGSITKTGNSFARKLLLEAVWSYRHPARISPAIQVRQENLPNPIIDRAWDAQIRLCRRYRKLQAKGKQVNITIVTVARELAEFIWDMGWMAVSCAHQSLNQKTI